MCSFSKRRSPDKFGSRRACLAAASKVAGQAHRRAADWLARLELSGRHHRPRLGLRLVSVVRPRMRGLAIGFFFARSAKEPSFLARRLRLLGRVKRSNQVDGPRLAGWKPSDEQERTSHARKS